MPVKTIHDFDPAGALDGTEEVELQLAGGGLSKRTTTQAIADLGGGGGGHVLTEDLTLYVAKTGNDANDGSLLAPFLTVQRAASECALIQTNGYTITVQLGDGVYDEEPRFGGSSVFAFHGGSYYPVVLQGNALNPAAVTLAQLDVFFGAAVVPQNLILGNNTTSALRVTDGGSASLGSGVTFGPCTGQHAAVYEGGFLFLYQSYAIAGDAQYHILCYDNGYVDGGYSEITGVGNPAFSAAFIRAEGAGASARLGGFTFAGDPITAAKPYELVEGGSITANYDVLAENTFPGTLPGFMEPSCTYGGRRGPLTTVAGLAALTELNVGARATVTDATATVFNSVVAGTGANVVPVYLDNAGAWRIG